MIKKISIIGCILLGILLCTVRIHAQTSQVSPVANLVDPQNVSVMNDNINYLQGGLNSLISQVANIQASYPSGIIVMWSGSIASIPPGWALCNGANGTPDLRNRFVVGAYEDVSSVANTTVTGADTISGNGQIPETSLSIGYGSTGSGFALGTGDWSYSGVPTVGTGTLNIAVYYSLAYIMKT